MRPTRPDQKPRQHPPAPGPRALAVPRRRPFPFDLNRTTGAALLALALALVLSLSGCSFEDESDEDAAVPAEDTTRTADARTPGQVSTPTAGWRDVDPDRLEAERYDESWRQSAQRELDERRRLRAELDARVAAAEEEGSDPGAAGTRSDTMATGGGAPVRNLKRRAGSTAGAAGEDTRSGAPDQSADQSADQTADQTSGRTAGADIDAVEAGSETWEDITADGMSGPVALPVSGEAAGPTALRVQWMLDRVRFSPGVIDGRWGKNTEKAVYWLQEELGMETTGEVDEALYRTLSQAVQGMEPLTRYRVTSSDLSGPFVTVPEEPGDQAELDCLCFESAEEMLAERFHTTPELLAQLNPEADLENLSAGDSLWVPNVEVMREDMGAGDGEGDEIDRIVVSKEGFYLHALDAQGNVLYHFPSTLGAGYDPSPDGSMEINTHAYEPEFHYQPKLFSDVPDSDEDHMLPGGPNSPVGMVWLDLSRENYGIHGTAEPASIGYTTSHGCVRLTNWDALFLANHVADGTPVEFRR